MDADDRRRIETEMAIIDEGTASACADITRDSATALAIATLRTLCRCSDATRANSLRIDRYTSGFAQEDTRYTCLGCGATTTSCRRLTR